MAEVAGLALGVLGIASLFSSCVENFDIVVRAKEFSKDFDLQCTLRFRLGVWGESLGLVESSQLHQQYKQALEQPDLQSLITSALHQLNLLLNQADVVTGRYALRDEGSDTIDSDLVASSHGMTVFRESFEKFRDRLKGNQKQKSVWMVTRWSIHDQARFETLVSNITKLIDGLEAITAHLGLLEQQRAKLGEEIASLSDTESLRLLQDVGFTHAADAASRAASDTASLRLTLLTTSSSSSYFTAPTTQSLRSMSINMVARPGNRMQASLLQWAVQVAQDQLQGEGIEVNSYPSQESLQPSHPDHDRNSQNLEINNPEDEPLTDIELDVPQHQRWMAALTMSQPEHRQMRDLPSDNSHYGTSMSTVRDEDEKICTPRLAWLMAKGGAASSPAQRIFMELRNIQRAEIPFISAAPVGDALDKILASVEGPPGTPYQGGIFWITALIGENKPPSLRFQTRIYHPNIDHTGRLCADYHSWWRESTLINTKQPGAQDIPWFSRLVTHQFNLGALLVAVCGLLASPNIDDPLVPEIAEKYITDFDGYCDSAIQYTKKYAHVGRPREEDLVFATDLDGNVANARPAFARRRTVSSSFASSFEGTFSTWNPRESVHSGYLAAEVVDDLSEQERDVEIEDEAGDREELMRYLIARIDQKGRIRSKQSGQDLMEVIEALRLKDKYKRRRKISSIVLSDVFSYIQGKLTWR